MKHRALFLLIAAAAAVPAAAEPTRIMVRAASGDAKYIGTSMGGVNIVIRDAKTGRVLAKGQTAGGTGDTKKLVTEPRVRHVTVSDDKSAGFEAVVDVDAPTLVKVEGYGPAGKPGAAISVSSALWVLPGRHLGGDGFVLNFPGLVVEPEAVAESGAIAVKAKVTLMCGCPLEAGGIWDANGYAVTARLMRGSREVSRETLRFTGKTSEYAGRLTGVAKGRYTLQISAADSKTINAGVGEMRVTVR